LDSDLYFTDQHRYNPYGTEPTSVLLSAQPVLALRAEISSLLNLRIHFGCINSIVFTFLSDDRHADHLRATLRPLNKAIYDSLWSLDQAIVLSRNFYGHNHDEISGQRLPTNITEHHVRDVLHPNCLNLTYLFLKKTPPAIQRAGELLRAHVIPHLSSVQEELTEYVRGYDRKPENREALVSS
ncbi:hypothetical protein PIIN_11516, partial [Serendipita indica DSM 11827]